jgi:3'(2'), 5'-bisphosphate nucleotidase
MKNLLETAIKASLKAGKRIMEIYENEDFEVDFKEDDSPLTKADLASHEIIMSYLEPTQIPILSEEGAATPYEERRNWKRLWIVDPLDGTKEFIKRNGEFTVNIALVEDQKPVLGVIYVPVLKQLYFAEKASGSFMLKDITQFNCLEYIFSHASKLPNFTNKKHFTVVASKSHLSSETEEYIAFIKKEKGEVEIISKGSSLKLCMVAEGQADVYPRFGPTMEWDTAAGQAICVFAGKTVLDYKTKEEMLYNREQLLNNWFFIK